MDLSFTIQTWMWPVIVQTLLTVYFCRSVLDMDFGSSLDEWLAAFGIWVFSAGGSLITHHFS